jgi:LacI family transcriptional regulator, galactose operon repressor
MPKDLVSTKDERPTQAAIASVAGVSVATVSKVVNGRPDVAPSTRALVQELLHEHAYISRRLDPTRVPSIELLYQGALTPYTIEVLTGVLDAAADTGVDVVVAKRPGGESGTVPSSLWARRLVTAGRQAVIAVASDLTPADVSALARARVPIVVIDPLNMPRARVVSVGSTNFSGGLAATQHLLDLGHRRIAYLGGPKTAACNQARLHGYRAAMDAAGIRIGKGYVRSGHFHYEDGLVEGAELLALVQPPTAIFAGNDETALGVIEAARTRGLRVPEELSVAGFDDTESARVASPQLTTVAQPLQRMGAVALRTALRLAAGERVDSHHVELATELVVRGSTAPPAPTANP